jgi:heat shock protein HtpX
MKLWNTFKTTILLAGLTGLLLAIGSSVGGQLGLIIAFALAIAMNMGAWWFSDKIALRMNGAKEVSYDEAPDLHRLVEELSSRAGLPKPRLYVIETDAPNAFATGRSPAKGAVAVTTGLMQMLNRSELAGVIAHELAHIKHRDTLIASVAATIAGAVTMLAEMAQWALIFGLGGFGEEEEGGGLGDLAGSLLMIILAPIAALLIQLAISRSREFSADAGGAEILGDPLPLANALEKLEAAAGRAPLEVNPAASPLYIVNPLRGGLSGLFRTHPHTAERIKRLHALARPEQLWAAGQL